MTHEMEDDERGTPKPIGFITGVKTDGTEIVSLFSPRAFADPEQVQFLRAALAKMSGQMKWVSGGTGTSVLANTLAITRKIDWSVLRNFYRTKSSFITPKTILGSHGEAPPQFEA
jgi:hypothetical protein